MKALSAILMAGVLCTGCAAIVPAPGPPKVSLDQADAKMAAADYSGAQTLYTEFVNSNPGNPQAVRARAIQAALDRLLSAQTELDRLSRSDEVPRLRREIAERQGEVDRLRAENAKLRADLERVRNIELQTLPGPKK